MNIRKILGRFLYCIGGVLPHGTYSETAQFASAFEISHCFLLCLSEDQMFIVPTRGMSAAEAETMRTILARELGDRFFTLFTRRKR